MAGIFQASARREAPAASSVRAAHETGDIRLALGGLSVSQKDNRTVKQDIFNTLRKIECNVWDFGRGREAPMLLKRARVETTYASRPAGAREALGWP